MKRFLLLSILVAHLTTHAQKKKVNPVQNTPALQPPAAAKYIQQRNTPPIVNAGDDQTITLPANNVMLNGSARDRENNIIHYQWTQLPSRLPSTIVSQNTPQTRVTGLQEGAYQFVLTVVDRFKAVGRDTVTVTVNPAALPPTANAGPDQTITLPANATQLNGSGSDPGQLNLSYRWSKLSGPDNIHIISPTSPQTKIEYLSEGTYQLILTVTNSAELSAYDTIVITVNPRPNIPNQPPTVKAGPHRSITLPGNSLTITSEGSDPDGDSLTYRWQQLSGPGNPGISPHESASTRLTNLQQGSYVFQVTVDDNKGGIATDTVGITVNSPQQNAVIDTPVITPIQPENPPSPSGFPVWIWIAIGVPVIGAVTTGFYLTYINRQRKKVIVYFMNAEEEALAHSLIPSHDKTEGYVMGDATKKNIKEMKKRGLALRILNTTTLRVNTPGVTRTYKYTSKKGIPTLQTISKVHPGENFVNILQGAVQPGDNSWPAFYIMTLDCPLLDVFRRQLEEAKVIVLQRVPDDSYIIVVNSLQQLESLQDRQRFGFIRAITEYTAEDTGFTVRKDRYNTTHLSGPNAVFIMDLVLHREDDKAIVNDFLGINQVERLGDFGRTIRIRMRANTDLPAKLASNKYIQAIYEDIPRKWHNDIARQIVGIDAAGMQQVTLLNEDGRDEIVAVADTGVDQNHPDLQGRIIGAEAWGGHKSMDDPSGHGTHVAGTIAGTGHASNGAIKGMAPGAMLFFQSLLDDDENICNLQLELPNLLRHAFDHQARILNISWGAPTEGYYTFDSSMIDQFVYDNPEMLVVVSAGNDGTMKKDRNGKDMITPGSVGSPATTKNGLTVGASFSTRMNEDGESMTVFSSRGPCKPDRRIKPDIVAPGTNILSTRSTQAPARNFDRFYDNDAYVFLSGTSMATPVVSGAAAIIREYYRKKGIPRPSAALIKATLINGTRRLTGASSMAGTQIVPNNGQGFGMLDLLHTIPNKKTPLMLAFRDSYLDPALALNISGQRCMFRLTLKRSGWVRLCMVFIDNPKAGMQSDLDLIMALEGTTSKWTGNAGINDGDAAFSDTVEDFTNNIEIIREENAAAGTYTIEVVATNIAPQAGAVFSLVVTAADTTAEFINIQP